MNQGENIISRLSAPQYDTRGMALLGQNFQSAMKSGSDLLNEYGKKQAENLANAKASELMANGDIKSLQQASPLLAYASEPMQKQAQSLLGSLQADRSYGLQENEFALRGQEVANSYEHQKAMEDLAMKNHEFDKYKYANMSAAEKASYAAQMAGIGIQQGHLGLERSKFNWEKEKYPEELKTARAKLLSENKPFEIGQTKDKKGNVVKQYGAYSLINGVPTIVPIGGGIQKDPNDPAGLR